MELIWLVAAFLSGMVAKAIKLPTLVGYLAAGLVLAFAGVESTPLIKGIGDLGVVLLLFTVGLHISLRSLVQIQVLGVGLIHLLVSGALFTLVLSGFQFPLFPSLIIAIGLGFSSTVLTAKSLDSRRELDSYHGRLAIGILILQDIVAVLLLLVSGDSAPSWWALLLFALPLLRPLLIFILGLVGREELLLVFGLLVALGGGWLFEQVGLDAKLGALVIGLVLAGNERSEELYDTLWGLKELFLVGFFLQVGLAGFPDASGWRMIALLLGLLPFKAILFFLLMVAFNLRSRTAFLSSLSLTAYSEFALIVAAAAATAGLVDPTFVVTIGVLVALSYAINAPLSRFANELWLKQEGILIKFERQGPHPDHEPKSLGLADFVIVGMGRAGAAAYDYLIDHGKRPLGFDADPAKIKENLDDRRRVIFGDANDPELWTGLDLSRLKGVLFTIENVTADTRAIRGLKEAGFKGSLVALARFVEHREALEQIGVNVSFLPINQAGRELAQASLDQLELGANS
jgi:predicted Kef-type K+ transport protein